MDYYSILGIERSATADEIKKAYRKKAMQHHPDRDQGDHAKFQEIQQAYNILSDPEKRAQYDNPQPEMRQFRFTHDNIPDDVLDHIHRVFGADFGGLHGFGRRQPKRNKDLQIMIEVDLKDTLEEQEKTISIKTSTGERFPIQIKIPRGIQSGATIRIPGQGDNALPNMPRGDLLIVVQVNSPPGWEILGHHLVTTMDITAFEAMLGVEKDLLSVDQKTFRISIPAGTQHNTRFALRGQGLYQYGNNERGDIVVIAQIKIPTNLNEEQKELIQKAQNIH